MDTMHLWWNGYDHAPGRTAEEARLWMLQECGVDVPADEWEEMRDDEYMRDEDGSISIPSETAAQMAAAMIAESPLRPAPVREEPAPATPGRQKGDK